MITHSYDQCKECGCLDSLITDFQSGTIVCRNCGVVQEERIIDETYEGRVFNKECTTLEGKEKRVRGPTNPYEQEGDNFKNFLKDLEETASILMLHDSTVAMAKDLALNLYEKKNNTFKGKSKALLAADLLYITCLSQNIPETLSEISRKLDLSLDKLNHYYKKIKKTLCIKNETTTSQAAQAISSKCNASSLEQDIGKFAEEICQLIIKNEILEGRAPKTITGCSIYIASKVLGKKTELKQIALVAECSEAAITSAYKACLQYKEYILPDAYKQYLDRLA